MRSILIVVAAVLAACSSSTDLQPGDEFTLHPGERVQIGGGAAAVRFVAVPQDSRCPSDVVCVWAGDAVARLDLVVAGDSARIDLHTNAQAGNTHLEAQGYALELTGLDPAPRSGSSIPQAQYAATLRLNTR